MIKAKIELIDCYNDTIELIHNEKATRDDVAINYYWCLNSTEELNWSSLNHLIISRWGKSSLEYIKKKAWSMSK